MSEKVIEIRNLKKKYRLGTIGGGTLQGDIQSWWARLRGKEDPNTIIGQNMHNGQKEFMALKGINLDVYKGEALGIIGGNGAGKSTMLKLLSHVTAPTEGEIKIKGRITSMLEVGTGFHGELTGRENIYLNGAILGMSKKEVDSKIDDIIEFSECGDFIDTPVKRYSSGMYVKLAFAVAAHLDSDIMIMDEVLAVGDMKFQEKCLGKMGDVAEQGQKTVLYVSHNMSTIRKLCTRCIVLNKGEIIFNGDVEKAIEIYLGNGNIEFITDYDLSKSYRCTGIGQKIWVYNVRFLKKDKASFLCGEKIQFEMNWKAKEKVEDVRIGCTIVREDNTPIGTAFSMPLMSANKNEYKTTCFEMDLSSLIPGTYFFSIDLYAMNSFGTYVQYDHPGQKIYFEITEDESKKDIPIWQQQYWGNIEFNRIVKIGEKDV